MTTPLIDIGTAVSGAADQVTAQVGAALPVILPVAGGLIAIGIAWRFVKRFVRG